MAFVRCSPQVLKRVLRCIRSILPDPKVVGPSKHPNLWSPMSLYGRPRERLLFCSACALVLCRLALCCGMLVVDGLGRTDLEWVSWLIGTDRLIDRSIGSIDRHCFWQWQTGGGRWPRCSDLVVVLNAVATGEGSDLGLPVGLWRHRPTVGPGWGRKGGWGDLVCTFDFCESGVGGWASCSLGHLSCM